jgi:hypothetical protein
MSYLCPRGSADIFFATDFDFLQRCHWVVTGRPATVLRSEEFLHEFADHEKTQVIGRYNPMLNDYENTRFLLG